MSVGQSRSNATGVGTSTLLGETLVEQVLTMNVESPGYQNFAVARFDVKPGECQTSSKNPSPPVLDRVLFSPL